VPEITLFAIAFSKGHSVVVLDSHAFFLDTTVEKKYSIVEKESMTAFVLDTTVDVLDTTVIVVNTTVENKSIAAEKLRR
jgi:hypothetical protein